MAKHWYSKIPWPRVGLLGAVAVTVTAVSLAACLGTVQRAEPDLTGLDVHLTILHTSDIHSRLFPYEFLPNLTDRNLGLLPQNGPFGGAARIAYVINRERGQSARFLHLDSGDAWEGAPVFNLFNGEAEFRAMSAMGTDAAALGNHEFDRGPAILSQQIAQWATYPILASNYVFNQQQFPVAGNLASQIAPYALLNVEGLRVGVIGMGNDDSLETIDYADNGLGIRAIDNVQALTSYVRLLRPMVDVLIVVSHMGLSPDEGIAENLQDGTLPNGMTDPNEELAIDGVDLILGGHLHIVTDPPKTIYHYDSQGNYISQTIICHSSAFAKFVGRLDLDVKVGDPKAKDPIDQRGHIAAFTDHVIPIDDSLPDDPKVARILEPYHLATVRAYGLGNVFAYVNTDKVNRYDGSGGDSQLGNLVATSMRLRQSVNATFALTNTLGIRDDFYQGGLTIEDMFNVFPFQNTIVTLLMSGSEVQELLDYVAARSSQRGCQTQAEVSGVTFDMNCRRQKAENILFGDNCRAQAACYTNPIGASCTCTPLNPAQVYRVAVNDYIAAGGSGFIVLKRNTSQQDTGISLRDALTQYLRNLPPCSGSLVIPAPLPDAGRRVVDAYGSVGCIDADTQAHDGRVLPVFN